MKTLQSICFCLLISLLPVAAQRGPSDGQMPGMDTSLIKLMGSNTSFSAKANLEMIGTGAGGENMSMPLQFAMLDGKVRTEIDMTEIKSKSMPPEAVAQMKQMGMDRVVSIARVDKKKVFIIYPGLKSYASTPIPESSLQSLTNQSKTVKTELGKETVDGHPCVKNKMMIVGDDGKNHEFTVWSASDMKDFPVKFETTEDGTLVRCHYSSIQLSKPDAKLFEAPSDFKSYDSVEAMMRVVMQKMMGGAGQ
jgi:hypothetical protein